MDALLPQLIDTSQIFLHEAWLGKPVFMWLVFGALILGLLVFDLGIAHSRPHQMGFRESLISSLFYVGVGLAFGGWVWWELGHGAGELYFTGYLVEKTLSLDNIFVMSIVFSYFAVPLKYQHRVLFWGILGVIVLRGAMITLGVAVLHKFAWVLLLFAVFLVLTGAKMLLTKEAPPDIDKNPVVRVLKRFMNVTRVIYGPHFFVRQVHDGKIGTYATPLFLALVVIEVSDIIFAVDSVPAILAITSDPFIVYTSNIFAILGLRALYFLLAEAVHRFRYLRHALALLLMFIGGKILAADLLGLPKIGTSASLAITAILIAGGIAYSVLRAGKPERRRIADSRASS